MPNFSHSNRLLALEHELLGRQREVAAPSTIAPSSPPRHWPIESSPFSPPPPVSPVAEHCYQGNIAAASDNRLLALERQLGGHQGNSSPAAPNGSLPSAPSFHQPSPPQRSIPRSTGFTAHVFDTGEPIQVDYPRDRNRQLNGTDYHSRNMSLGTGFTAHVFDTGEPIQVDYPRDREEILTEDNDDDNIDVLSPWDPNPVSEPVNSASESEPITSDTHRFSPILNSTKIPAQGNGHLRQPQVQHNGHRHNGHRQMPQAPEPPPVFVSPSTIPEPVHAPPQAANNNTLHAAFGDLSHGLNHATAFDLGTVTVDIPFDNFDQRLDDEALAQAQRLEQRFDHFDHAIEQENTQARPERAPPNNQAYGARHTETLHHSVTPLTP